MVSRRVKRSARAEEDLIAIWSYIAQDNPAAADRLLDRFDQRWQLLVTQPRSGMARDDIAAGTRQNVMGKYLTFYRIVGGDIEIIRVLHGRRNIQSDDFSS